MTNLFSNTNGGVCVLTCILIFDECPKTLITNLGFSEIIDRFHIYMVVFDYFSNFGFYLVFVGETRENAEKGALQEAWRRVVQKAAQRHDVPTSRRCGKVSTNLISWRRYKRNGRITLWGFEINL